MLLNKMKGHHLVTASTDVTAEQLLAVVGDVLTESGEGVIVLNENGLVLFATSVASTLLAAAQKSEPIQAELVTLSGRRLPSLLECGTKPFELPLILKAKTPAGAEAFISVTGDPSKRVFRIADQSTQYSGAEAELDLLDIVTHDLRAGLVPAKTYAQMLTSAVFGPLNEKQTDAAKTIDISLQKQADRLSTVLDMVKAEQKRLEFSLESSSFTDIIKQAARSIERDCKRKKVELVVDMDPAAALIEADSQRLSRMLVNVLGRSLKQTSQGGSLGIELRYVAPGKARLCLWDTGPGTSSTDADVFFLRSLSERKSVTPAQKRALVELGPVYDMIAGHGGSISLQSVEGTGTTFIFHLPVHQKASAGPSTFSTAKGLLLAGVSGPAADVIKEEAERSGLAVTLVETGKQALLAARAKRHCIVCAGPLIQDLPIAVVLHAIAEQRPGDPQKFWIVGRDETVANAGGHPVVCTPLPESARAQKIIAELLASMAL